MIVSAVAVPDATALAVPVLPYTPSSRVDVMLLQRRPVSVLRCHWNVSAEESLDAAVTVSPLVVTGSLSPVRLLRLTLNVIALAASATMLSSLCVSSALASGSVRGTRSSDL